MTMKIWTCKIGEVEDVMPGADGPMRNAVDTAYRKITGKEPEFIFSGWGGELTHYERHIVVEMAKKKAAEELEKRVSDFNRCLDSNTSPFKLINDLWAEVKRLREEKDK